MPTEPQVWAEGELANPHEVGDKGRRVQRMFAAIARSYDLNNRLHSLGRDQAWRRAAVRQARLTGSEIVLDVACGTGDLALAFHQAGAARVVGVDFTFNMLLVARGKQDGLNGPWPSYHAGDALSLPIADQSVDVVSIAFGIRNVVDPLAALRQFHRVLRPGGRLIILEFSLPTRRWLRAAYQFYFNRVLPRTASWIARDRTGAYRYLPRSVNTFIDRGSLVSLLQQAGFTEVELRPLTFGIAVVYRGIKRAGSPGVLTETAGFNS